MKNTATKNNSAKKTEKAVNQEPTNRQQQFYRLVEATCKAREIQEQLIADATSTQKAIFFASRSVNFYLLNYVYKQEGVTEFKKFSEWKAVGATVKKGEKAYPIWGQPVGTQKEEEAQAKGEQYTASEEEKKHFPICYVFSNLQVREERGGVC